ncbi:MAG: sulfatase [Gammaproteobacteria bacterium]|nr:sulfatase [Gammaproteobacteria bacterium]
MQLLVSLLLAAFLTLSSQAAPAQSADRPNVLIIIVDDLRPEVAAYGDQVVLTPNIDDLANTGVMFENAFTAVPVCGASRAALFSGRKPTASRFLNFNSRLDADLPDAPSLPGYFQAHGYHTVSNGKVFDANLDSEDAWSEPPWNPDGDWTSAVARNARRDDVQRAYLDNPPGVTGPAYERLDVADIAYPDGKVAEKTVDDLRRLGHADAPFLIVAGFRKPHLPFTAPERYWSLYDPADFNLPSTYYATPDGAPHHPIHNSAELRTYAGIPEEGPLGEAQALTLIHAYHAAVSYADAQVGKVLDGLNELGLEDDTIVVLFGDHGWNLGEHTLWNKHTLFDVALRTPLIIRAPGRDSHRVSTVTSLLDVFPTLTDLSGLAQPEDLDGVSLAPVLNDPSEVVRTAAISRWFDGASVRTDRYRYTDWRDEQGNVSARMLFDLELDPEETRNVSEEGDYSQAVAELSALITADRSGYPWSQVVRDYVDAREDSRSRVD